MIKDLASLRKHHPALQRELEAVFEKYGLTLTRCAASISTADCRFTITTQLGDKQQQAENAREVFELYADVCGVPPRRFRSDLHPQRRQVPCRRPSTEQAEELREDRARARR